MQELQPADGVSRGAPQSSKRLTAATAATVVYLLYWYKRTTSDAAGEKPLMWVVGYASIVRFS
jgi:hypothetical protein